MRYLALTSVGIAVTFLVLAARCVRCEFDAPELRSENDRADDLENRRVLLDAQSLASDCVVDRLISGELSLAAAVTELAAINRDRLTVLRSAMAGAIGDPGLSEREALGWYAINKARRRQYEDPSAVPWGALDRIESEYLYLFDRAAPSG